MRAPRQPKKPRRITPNSPAEREGGGELTQRPRTHQDYIPTAPYVAEEFFEAETDEPPAPSASAGAPSEAREPDTRALPAPAGDEPRQSGLRNTVARIGPGLSSLGRGIRNRVDHVRDRWQVQEIVIGRADSLDARREERRLETRRLRIKKAGIAGAGIGALVVTAWILFGSPLLRYHYDPAQIEGYAAPSIVNRAELEALVAGNDGKNLLSLDTDAIERNITDSIPEVASVKVTKQYRHGLKVAITEAVPVACLGSTPCTAVTADGVKVDVPLELANALPRIGQIGDEIDSTRAVNDALTVLGSLSPSVLGQIAQISIANGSLVTLTLNENRTVYWGGLEKASFKAAVLEVLLTQPASFYDVSVPDAPVSR